MCSIKSIPAPKNWQSLERHEFSADFGDMSEADLQMVVTDMEEFGFRGRPVLIYKGKVGDGWHQLRGASKAGKVPTFEEFVGTDEECWQEAWRRNAVRRHYSESQRGMIAAKYASRGQKKDFASLRSAPQTQAETAAQMNVSTGTITNARKVLEEGTPALAQAVLNGTIKASDAAKIVDEPARVQNSAVKDVESGKEPTAAKAAANRSPVRCANCELKGATVKDCAGCKEARAAASAEKRKPADPPKSTDKPKDGNGHHYPDAAIPAVTQASRLVQLERYLRDGIELAEQIGAEPIGLYLDPAGIRQRLTEAKALVLASHPKYVCKNCKGEDKKCKWCKGQGWQTSGGYRQCPEPTK